jgi:hypothetical protein
MSCRDEVLKTARLLMAPGDVHEVRIIKEGRRGAISGYFDNPDKLAAAVAEFDGKYLGIYITLNPCNRDLLARANNRLKDNVERTIKDGEIVLRRWLGLDFDPIRLPGISSTNFEHGRAIAAACGVWDELRLVGWGDPIVADSGNGAHLLYVLDAPYTTEINDLLRTVLAGISKRCGTEDVAIDLTAFNAAQVFSSTARLLVRATRLMSARTGGPKFLKSPIGSVECRFRKGSSFDS